MRVVIANDLDVYKIYIPAYHVGELILRRRSGTEPVRHINSRISADPLGVYMMIGKSIRKSQPYRIIHTLSTLQTTPHSPSGAFHSGGENRVNWQV